MFPGRTSVIYFFTRCAASVSGKFAGLPIIERMATNDEQPNYEVSEETDMTGLNLFDERASAAGSFPHAMLGYDRTAVDTYVRDVEQQVSTLRQLTRHLRRELSITQSSQGETDFSRLGAHATSILRSAETQAEDLVAKAGLEAERIREEGRRNASDLRLTRKVRQTTFGFPRRKIFARPEKN